MYHAVKQYRYVFLLLLLPAFLFLTYERGTGEYTKGNTAKKGTAKTSAVLEEEDFLQIPAKKRGKIVLDAGHGGVDPGKVGTAGTKEKDINLSIVLLLKEKLLKENFEVILTREGDDGLYSAGSPNKKKEDMINRVRIMEEAEPLVVISIHQNSYPNASCRGAQVFYFRSSEKGESLAKEIQAAFPELLKDENSRQAKPNSSYYLLKKVTAPIVIAECGFLSCPEEEQLLLTESYREKVAEAVCTGLLRYLQKE